MNLKRKLNRQLKRQGLREIHPSCFLQYYSLVFKDLLKEIKEDGYDFNSIHEIRQEFWENYRESDYTREQSRELLLKYYTALNELISSIISRKSICYWLHILRRFAPKYMSRERDMRTTALTRSILEIAIQKYGRKTKCPNIDLSDRIEPVQILNGRLMEECYNNLAQKICNSSQLVLTNFDKPEAKEFYDINKLAYEIWKCGAGLRTIGKGGYIVTDDGPEMYGIWMSDELDRLLRIFGSRIEKVGYDHSATGTIFPKHVKDDLTTRNSILIARYNFKFEGLKKVESLFRKIYRASYPNIPINFFWVPFEIVEFYNGHKNWSEQFKSKHGFALEFIFLIMISLFFSIMDHWKNSPAITGVYRSHMRAYYGPIIKENIFGYLENKLPVANLMVGRSPQSEDNEELKKAFEFLSLTDGKRDQIEPLLRGPYSIFIPIDHDIYFIDYAWFPEILYNLFFKIEISDQNFKGEALERYISNPNSPLTSSTLTANDGKQKQIDASYDLGEGILAILECKAIGRSLGYERGDFRAIDYRNQIIDKILSEVDDKARWLTINQTGRNYDISHFDYILPIGLTPFIEFIPYLNEWYWINTELPRVLTPQEFMKSLEKGELLKYAKESQNLVSLSQ